MMFRLTICFLIVVKETTAKSFLIETVDTPSKPGYVTSNKTEESTDYENAKVEEKDTLQCDHTMGGLNTKDFLSADWIKSVKPCTEAMIKMEDDMFTISRGKDKTPVKINGFPITTAEYQKALDGEKVTLSADGQTAELVVKDGNVTIDGKSLNVGSSMTMTI
ncbi:uncharacterized protein LOC111713016 [Eurytemora carolleeae]|uniref:uncharacterized protein LOC111713016 n=1 Tax=Eurytemora carolleeae TaxID=1294199 RepID=UPI000C75D815|nr:uncharacterized protein LOC111713016 [Eurytemora carolleeae]|eukprot:XP_023343570.1 uncharacterized protein LOC111713016 [Eurytemora affinis]